MTHAPPLLRSLILYAICLPLALFLGYLLANPLQWSSFVPVLAMMFLLILPLLLRFHHPLMVLGWNATMIVFFLPGAPGVWLPLVAMSLFISVLRRTVDQRYRFITVPEITWPLVVLALIILATAEATGGIKLRSMGGEVYGGKKYIFLLMGIAGYFALTAQRVPVSRAKLYLSLFLLGGATTLIGDVLYTGNRALAFVYWFFPPNTFMLGETLNSVGTRFAGIAGVCIVLFSFMLAKYGIREIFSSRRPWRLIIFACIAFGSLLGGFRSTFIYLGLLFFVQFLLEKMHRTKLFPILLVGCLLAAVVTLPFAKKLPYGAQRALSVLPINIDQAARSDADASVDWRLEIWKAVLPQVPKYLWLGKGVALTQEDYSFVVSNYTGTMQAFSEDQSWAALAGDYHSGPLSVIIPFGIWGAAAFLWFLTAGFRMLYRNYRYGDPELATVNSFLFAAFCTKVILFFVIYGAFAYDMQVFCGYLGMSVCLNGGVARPAPKPVPETVPLGGLSKFPARRRPAFGRSGQA